MTCFIAQNELSAFADDALEMARAAELQDHLSGCAACSRELEEIRRVRTMLRTLPVHRAPADFLSKVTAKAQRKSLLERATAALAPVLQLPRPAQASLALAASLVVAVTVFWNNPNRGLSDLHSAPGASAGFREVANVQASTPLSLAEQSEDLKKESKLADAESQTAELDRLQPTDRSPSAKAIVGNSAPPPPSVADENALRADKRDAGGGRSSGLVQATPPPALALRAGAAKEPSPALPIGGVSNDASSRGAGAGAATGSSSYTAPTSAGLYASEPGAAATPARRKNDLLKPQAVPAKDLAAATTIDEDSHAEPSFESSGSFGQTGSGATDDGAVGDLAPTPDPMVVEEKTKTVRDVAGKKEGRRERAPAKAGEESEVPVVEAPAETESVAQAAAPAAVAPTLSAKYLSASSSAPAELVSAAKAAGGRVVSPASTPPGLGKVGASTFVTVEIPESGVEGFEAALRLGGTFERGTLPAGAVRYRIEVVRQ